MYCHSLEHTSDRHFGISHFHGIVSEANCQFEPSHLFWLGGVSVLRDSAMQMPPSYL